MCKHWGTVPEAAIFVFRLLEVVSQGTPFARAHEGCGLRDKVLLRCVPYSVCPPHMDLELDEITEYSFVVIKKHALKNLGPKMCTRIERGVACYQTKFAHM